MPMMAITTKSSTNVNPLAFGREADAVDFLHSIGLLPIAVSIADHWSRGRCAYSLLSTIPTSATSYANCGCSNYREYGHRWFRNNVVNRHIVPARERTCVRVAGPVGQVGNLTL